MREVAGEAGVHQTTVSLALRGHPSIPRATRERIRAVADRLGYKPNPLLSTLMSVRRRGRASDGGSILAFLTAYPTRDGWRRSLNYQYLFDAAAARAGELGYRLEAFWLTQPGMSPARMVRILLTRGIRGVLVCPLPSSLPALDFGFNEFAAVALGYTLQSPVLDQVAVDYYGVMQLAVARLRERGFSRIGFYTSSLIDQRVNHLSLGAFLAEKKIHGRGLLEPLVCDDREASIANWLDRTNPDAVIAATQKEYQLLNRLGRRSAIRGGCCFYVVDARRDSDQPGVVQALDEQGRAAVDVVTSRLERAEFGPPQTPRAILVRGAWRDRGGAGLS
jgi:LacI family transcriptional regulator